MSPEFTLDLGIGKGGRYIDSDNPRMSRIGFDIDDTALRLLRYASDMPLVRGDADVQQGRFSLPFATEAFQSVEVLFPHDELLYALTNRKALLWNELHRVLKPGAKVSVILDVPYSRIQGIYYRERPKLINNPHWLIQECAQHNGFNNHAMTELSPAEVRTLGTDFSNFAATMQEDYMPSKVHKITYIKA